MFKKNWNSNEKLELAEEHVKMAQDLVLEQAENQQEQKQEIKKGNSNEHEKKPSQNNQFEKAIFTLEKAESQIKELRGIVTGLFIVSIVVLGIFFSSLSITGNITGISDKITPLSLMIFLITIIFIAFFLITRK